MEDFVFVGSFYDLPSKSLEDLFFLADKTRSRFCDKYVDLCTISNAKSGLCPEDCRFCAQSVYHKTDINVYPLKQKNVLIEEAKTAKKNGAKRFSIVTSGNSLDKKEIYQIAEAINDIVEKVGIIVDASLGSISLDDLRLLKNAGLKRYHHNIETSKDFYPKIVSTHSFEQRINTIKNAKLSGLEVCSGGIIGLGETWKDRIDMALTLKSLDVDSVPINILNPIKGTPLEGQDLISVEDALKTIAIFRIILQDKMIKVAAGREQKLKDRQRDIFEAGANGILIGGYLTVSGRPVEEDLKLVKEVEEKWQKQLMMESINSQEN